VTTGPILICSRGPMRAAEAQVARLVRNGLSNPEIGAGCSSARVQSSTTWVRSSPSSTSAHAVSSTASCPAIRIPPSFLFDRVQQLPAGLLATAAGFGAHPAVLMHPGMPFALVAAALTRSRGWPERVCRTRRLVPACSSAPAPFSTTSARCSPSLASAPAGNSIASYPSTRIRSRGANPRRLASRTASAGPPLASCPIDTADTSVPRAR
jgi:hypothetical protein